MFTPPIAHLIILPLSFLSPVILHNPLAAPLPSILFSLYLSNTFSPPPPSFYYHLPPFLPSLLISPSFFPPITLLPSTLLPPSSVNLPFPYRPIALPSPPPSFLSPNHFSTPHPLPSTASHPFTAPHFKFLHLLSQPSSSPLHTSRP